MVYRCLFLATSATLPLALVALDSGLMHFRCDWNGSERKLPGEAAAVAASTAAAAGGAYAVAILYCRSRCLSATAAGEAAAVAGEANAVAGGAAVAPREVVITTAHQT